MVDPATPSGTVRREAHENVCLWGIVATDERVHGVSSGCDFAPLNRLLPVRGGATNGSISSPAVGRKQTAWTWRTHPPGPHRTGHTNSTTSIALVNPHSVRRCLRQCSTSRRLPMQASCPGESAGITAPGPVLNEPAGGSAPTSQRPSPVPRESLREAALHVTIIMASATPSAAQYRWTDAGR